VYPVEVLNEKGVAASIAQYWITTVLITLPYKLGQSQTQSLSQEHGILMFSIFTFASFIVPSPKTC
jgi:hypothetical protein